MMAKTALLSAMLLLVTACSTVKPYQKKRLADRTMIFDFDTTKSIVDNDVFTAREGAIGVLSDGSAGGCSCK